jgi:metal-responsive CopG/Arc/MetJ family transcriptional regulator
MSGATRTQVYLTAELRAGLDERARAEHKTMAHVIRDAIDRYLSDGVDDAEREQMFADTFGALPDLARRVPSRDEWDRGA